MKNVDLDNFIKTGVFYDIALGKTLNLAGAECDFSFEKNTDGTSKLYKYYYQNGIWNIGTKEGHEIVYIVMHLKDQNVPITIGSKDKLMQLDGCMLESLLLYLNANNIDWGFEVVHKKIIALKILSSRVQFVFSFYEDESPGLQIIQVALETNL